MAKPTETTGTDVESMITDLTSRLEKLREELLETERTLTLRKKNLLNCLVL